MFLDDHGKKGFRWAVKCKWDEIRRDWRVRWQIHEKRIAHILMFLLGVGITILIYQVIMWIERTQFRVFCFI